ncbi:hypothetical protein RY831_22630 [Noviherbaspirillum sp. CPCC 100848]|uniref:VanZ-like domain-containing protein n=1 Tax=Noviherbaspirillum album TaxID=3080276 RepID=A0ABU6JE85_9BURK|nr:hypothetical protein [Noviherbaspirillum sp. CPCC 100848]MEC4721970.1 hypothetical protein [Noviherbaspirillum sp. CPCC 100848]
MRKRSLAVGSRYPTQRILRMSAQQRCLFSASIVFTTLLVLDAAPQAMTALSSIAEDKLLRFIAYALLSTLIYAGLAGSPASRAVKTLALVFVMGGVEEAIQLMLPYHSANLLGWKFDMLAALTCVGMLMMLHPVFSDWHASQRLRPARLRTRPEPMMQVQRRRNVQ